MIGGANNGGPSLANRPREAVESTPLRPYVLPSSVADPWKAEPTANRFLASGSPGRPGLHLKGPTNPSVSSVKAVTVKPPSPANNNWGPGSVYFRVLPTLIVPASAGHGLESATASRATRTRAYRTRIGPSSGRQPGPGPTSAERKTLIAPANAGEPLNPLPELTTRRRLKEQPGPEAACSHDAAGA